MRLRPNIEMALLRPLAALLLLGGVACGTAPARKPSPDSVAKPASQHALLGKLPPVDALPVGPGRLGPALDEAATLLEVVPPNQPQLQVDEDPDEARVRRKIEAYFETGLRWEDDLRLRAVELIGALMDGVPEGRDPVLSHALSALVLEDLAALGFDAAGAYYSPSFDIPPDRLAEAMARPEVIYSALAAQAYQHCQAAADQAGAFAWSAFCAQGRQAMLVFAQSLPACTAPSVFSASEDAAGRYSLAPDERPRQAGLLLHAASGVPLLTEELDRLADAVHAHLAGQLPIPVLPVRAPATEPAGQGACVHERRPSEALLQDNPGTLWYGLFLHCDEQGCGLGVCSDADGACQRATLDGAPTDLGAWLAAVARLTPTPGGVLLDTTGSLAVTDRPQVAISDVQLFGTWHAQAPARQTLSEMARELLACQAADRYHGRWVLDVARDGSVRSTRGESERFAYPMDQGMAAAGAQGRCIQERFSLLNLGKGRPGGARRVTFDIRIPAKLQVELPFTVRHDRQLGQIEEPNRLGRDGFAVALAQCAAGAEPQLSRIGVCMELAPDGHISGLTVDPAPARRARVLGRLAGTPPRLPDQAVTEMQVCLVRALSRFDWMCREGDAGTGHLALTVELPRGLLARFE